MASKQEVKVEKWKSRDAYSENWSTPLKTACFAKPGYCCFAMLCPQCASYLNRKQALRGDMSRYICCNGDWPCSGKMKEQSCPEFCLCTEVCCCFAQSVASTRWMLQDELRIQNTKCDNCIIGCMVALQYLSCVCNIVACLTDSSEIDEAADAVDLLADVVWCTVCGCMQTQAKVELELRDSGNHPNARAIQMAAPVPQEMGRFSETYPPPAPGHGPPPVQHMPHYGPPGGAAAPPGYPRV